MENKEAEEKIKQFDNLIAQKKNEVEELDKKLEQEKKWGWNQVKWDSYKREWFFVGVGRLIGLGLIVVLLIIGFILGKLF